ncbi:MAG: hypothetical protein NBV67_01550 [Tagaea sp.]|nr:hypothetical protein [Tagaea sp.]
MTANTTKAGFALSLPHDDWDWLVGARPAEIEPIRIAPDWRDLAPLAELDALVVGTQIVPLAVLDAAPNLRLVQRWGTGTDNLDRAALRARGLAVAELPGVNARSVAEFGLLAILSLLRHAPDIAVAWSRGEWNAGRADVPPRRLTGKTIGLLGFGAIGRDLARLLRPFDAEILFHDLRAPEPPEPGIRGPLPKNEILRRADVVFVSLPSNAATRGAVGGDELALMKPTAILVSVARADVIDEAAVRAAVRAGSLAAASFDCHAREPLAREAMFHQPGVFATPHIGGASREGFEALVAACYASIAAHCGAKRPPSG